MFGLVYQAPTIDPDDDRGLLIERLSIEIAVMTSKPEPHLYNRMGKVVLRSGTYVYGDAVSELCNMWLESYVNYLSEDGRNHQLTAQVALWAANDTRVTQLLRTAFRLRGREKVIELVNNLMTNEFRHQIDEDFGGLEDTCWLTVARELPLR